MTPPDTMRAIEWSDLVRHLPGLLVLLWLLRSALGKARSRRSREKRQEGKAFERDYDPIEPK